MTHACHTHWRPKVTLLRLLLIPPLLLGALFWYHRNYYWHVMPDPTANLEVVRSTSVLHPFRKRTITDIIEPCQVELSNLKLLVRQTKGSSQYHSVPPDWDRRTAEILDRLLELMEQAKLRRIPECYEKEYVKVLWGILQTYVATLSFREYCAAGPNEDRVRSAAYKRSKKYRKKANSAFKKGREWFGHDAKSVI